MLHKELQDLTEALVHSESHLCGVTSDTMQVKQCIQLCEYDYHFIQVATFGIKTYICQSVRRIHTAFRISEPLCNVIISQWCNNFCSK